MTSQQNDFEQLQALLGCKRYEQPPPGYFNRFSAQVLDRIAVEQNSEHSSWWTWLMDKFEAKPVLACAYGLAVSSLLLVGFKLSQVFEAEAGSVPAMGGSWLAITPIATPLSGAFDSSSLVDQPAASYVTSLSPAFRPGPAGQLFRGNFHFQSASFNSAH